MAVIRFDDDSINRVLRTKHYPSTHTAMVYLPIGNCCNRDSCIAYFQKTDPDISTIFTFAGDVLDVVFTKAEDGYWSSTANWEEINSHRMNDEEFQKYLDELRANTPDDWGTADFEGLKELKRLEDESQLNERSSDENN